MEQLAVLRGRQSKEIVIEARVQLAGEINQCEFKLAQKKIR